MPFNQHNTVYPILNTRISVLRPSSFISGDPLLDFETRWTGEQKKNKEWDLIAFLQSFLNPIFGLVLYSFFSQCFHTIFECLNVFKQIFNNLIKKISFFFFSKDLYYCLTQKNGLKWAKIAFKNALSKAEAVRRS